MPNKYGSFVVGEVVQLKGGGPAMTVRQVQVKPPDEPFGDKVLCDYFHGVEHMQATFWPKQLEIHPDYPQHDMTPDPEPDTDEENIA